jgi:nicotinamidase-related amidase
MVNDFEFEHGEALLKRALPMAHRIAALKERAYAAQVPVIYVNDNFSRWHSDLKELVEHCLTAGVRGEPVVRVLEPRDDDYFILKPRHSAFYGTSLDVFLEHLGVETLILTGIAADICVLFTANDAYMREYRVLVPADCVDSENEADYEHALRLMQKTVKADLTVSTELDLVQLKRDTA